MNRISNRLIFATVAGLAVAGAAPTAAQTLQGLDNFTLERPAPARPVADPTPVPVPVLTVEPSPVPTPAPVASATGAARSTARRVPSALTSGAQTPAPVTTVAGEAVTPAPNPIATGTPAAAPDPAAVPEAAAWSLWWAALGLVALIVGAGIWFYRRRRDHDVLDLVEPYRAPPPPAPPPPPPVAMPSGGFVTSSLRPRIELGFHPLRAGVDTLRARVDYELAISNAGSAAAREARVELVLLSAGNSQDAALATFFSGSSGTPIAPPLILEPGVAARLAGQAVLEREAFDIITAGGRRMIVPLIAVRVLGASGALLAKGAWLVGIERAGEARMMPLRLDSAQMRSDVGSRVYGSGS